MRRIIIIGSSLGWIVIAIRFFLLFYTASFSPSVVSLARVPRHVYEEEKRERKERKWKRIDGKIRTARRASRPGRRPSLVQSFLQLCACGILGAGLWLRLAYSGYTTLVPHYSFASADSLLLAAGCVTFVIAFFGCCGAWFQSRCMLITVRIYISLLRILRQTFNLLLFFYSISAW